MMHPTPIDHACPTCGRTFIVESDEQRRRLPFCSSRCKLIDLGKWFNEEYRISRDLQPEEMLEADVSHPRDDADS